MFTVYALYSEKYDKIYIGVTSNIQQRMLSHNQLSKKGWTVRFRPWVIVHTEEFQDKQLALKREKQLKTAKGREFIREIIAAGSYPPDGGQQFESGPRYQHNALPISLRLFL